VDRGTWRACQDIVQSRLTVWVGSGITWNIFRSAAAFCHLFSVFILICKMVRLRSCGGISFNTQFLYLIVHCTCDLNNSFSAPPDLFLGRSKQGDALNWEYIFFMSICRLLYLINWVYQLINKKGLDIMLFTLPGPPHAGRHLVHLSIREGKSH
jgi:hypothetical protein